MDASIIENRTGLLLLIQRLVQTGRELGRATLLPFAELKLPGVAGNYEALVRDLLERQEIQGDAESFTLTQSGEEAVRQAAEKTSLTVLFYNAYYAAVVHSKAHARFCERVYGLNLCQHGMADMSQVGRLLSELKVEPGMALLDFGCGDGRISEYIYDTARVDMTGVDIAYGAIALAQARTRLKRDRLRFDWADIEGRQGSFPGGPYDRILAIDSLFFVRDQPAAAAYLLDRLKPGGRMGVFYHCPPDIAAPDTRLAVGLRQRGVSCRALDLSQENARHWRLKKSVLLELEPQFRAEGNLFLYKNRLAECDGLEHFHRYLYIVQP